jgi:D-alanyl-D-alanine carboxypeptidase
VDNPFMGNNKGNPHAVEMAERASLLMGGAMHNPLSKPSQAKDHTSASEEDRAARADKAEAQWAKLHADSEMLRRYLNLSSDEVASNFAANRQAIAAWQKKHSDSSLAAEAITDLGWWQTQHAADKAHPRGGDLQKGSDPAQHGFMTVQKELVTALVQAGLTWGGMYNTGKDLMHFDLRTGSIRGRPVV